MHLQYGCGTCAPEEWLNYDSSLTLRVQRTPILRVILKNHLNVAFPKNVLFGDITTGLPRVLPNSCDGVFCSHVLEHLSFEDAEVALRNTFIYLKSGGVFRCVVPDLEVQVNDYVRLLAARDDSAAHIFMKDTRLGWQKRPKTILELVDFRFANRFHFWMYDEMSLTAELKRIGFSSIHRCQFNDCPDKMFSLVERRDRFENALALEAVK